MRLLIATVGSRGDVQPLLALALALRKAGHGVTLATPPNFCEWVRSFGLCSAPIGSDIQKLVTSHGISIAHGSAAVLATIRKQLKAEIRTQFQTLTSLLSGHDAILGAGALVAGHSVALAHGIPYGFVIFCPQYLRSKCHPPPTVPWISLPSLVNGLLWWTTIRLFNQWLLADINAERARLRLRDASDFYSAFIPPNVIVPADPLVCTLPDDFKPRPFNTGFWAFEEPERLSGELCAFVRKGQPPVYAGFGSMPDPDPNKTTNLLLEVAERLSLRLVLARGWSRIGERSVEERHIVVNSASHRALFQHVSAVIHHGGAGTFYEAARAGVPQLIVPHGMDQFFWAKKARDLGLAPVAIARAKLSGAALEKGLRTIFEDSTYREAAIRFAPRLQTSHALDRAIQWVESTLTS